MFQPWGSGKAAFKKPLLSGYLNKIAQKGLCVNHFLLKRPPQKDVPPGLLDLHFLLRRVGKNAIIERQDQRLGTAVIRAGASNKNR